MTKKTVVIIDDDEDVREILIYTLESEGFKILPFDNGHKALEVLKDLSKEDLPGLIIVDYMMPEMDWVTFINEIKSKYEDRLGHIPVALSTAMGTMEDFSLPPGIIQLFKPMELDELIRVVYRYCQK